MSKFQDDITKFNGMYKLPVALKPTLATVGDARARLRAFKEILVEELEEIDLVINEIGHARIGQFSTQGEKELDALTSLADLLGDLQVYCASEMAKFGLPLDRTLEIIMQSNLSKLGADGLPIYDERGKVQKGPGYWKPEPALRQMLVEIVNDDPRHA